MTFLVSAKFRCQILVQGISDGTKMIIYHVLTIENPNSLIQFHVLRYN